MSGVRESGISPALLQAITHTISTKPAVLPESVGWENDPGMDTKSNIFISRDPKYQQIIRVEGQGHSIEEIQRAISALGQQSANTVFVVSNAGHIAPREDHVDNVLPVVKIESDHPSTIHEPANDVETSMSGLSESARSVVSLIASQAHQNDANRHTETVIPSAVYNRTPVIKIMPENVAQPVFSGHDVAMSEVDNVVTETVIQTSYHPDPLDNMENIEPPGAKKVRIIEMSEGGIEDGETTTTYILNPDEVDNDSVAISTNQGAMIYRAVSHAVASVAAEAARQSVSPSKTIPPEYASGCPVCGDKITGYHYGSYSCESCKGFFKRTVQNKKAFICHRLGECAVSIGNRKKCPACRFKQCLNSGMKLEAIREDRARGGRSSYEGCSPNRPVKMTREPRKPAPPRSTGVLVNPIVIQTPTGSISIPSTPTTTHSTTYSLASPNHTTPKTTKPQTVDVTQVQPQTPQLLEDLMAVESLMTEDEGEQACCDGKLIDGDTSVFESLLHFADHCLYKIVRWARNLPDFASVSTDDQIVLLQNCWAELLCLCCCWKSLRSSPGTLKLCHGRVLTIEQARDIGMEEIIQRMLDITEALRQLEMDNYEFVTMKGLLLLSPDVKNLKGEDGIRQYQDRLIEALMVYTTTNSPRKADKFCKLLARLPELTRCCVHGKDQLAQRQVAGEVPQYSLLSELLKGDGAMS